ncbi:TPA: SMEK domain-containing protein, partial [Klebsiella quasipneumoniae]|nr:SMEK domain-containing protein [Klebsiella quasipneumoniae]
MKFNDLNEEAIVLTRQKKNNNITFAFSLLSTVITFNSKQGLFDINKTMELVLTDLLSHVYNLSLTNLNV